MLEEYEDYLRMNLVKLAWTPGDGKFFKIY
jgi:hypothetical protein